MICFSRRRRRPYSRSCAASGPRRERQRPLCPPAGGAQSLGEAKGEEALTPINTVVLLCALPPCFQLGMKCIVALCVSLFQVMNSGYSRGLRIAVPRETACPMLSFAGPALNGFARLLLLLASRRRSPSFFSRITTVFERNLPFQSFSFSFPRN